MKRFILAPALFAAASSALAAFRVPGYELVYSYPVETTLNEPDLRPAQDVWPEMFDAAKNTIDVEEFYVTPSAGEPLEPSLKALERAAMRGVKIRVLLEKKFEKQSADGIARLKAIPGLELRLLDWSKVQGAGIIHAKFFVVDSTRAFVGSQNLDWRSLKHIHELGLAIDDGSVVYGIQSVFTHDWQLAGLTGAPTPDNIDRPLFDRDARSYLVASPWRFNPTGVGDSESELVQLIGEARTELLIQNMEYAPLSFGEPKRFYPVIDNALRDAAVRGVKVKLLIADWAMRGAAIAHIQSLAQIPGVEIRVITIPPASTGPIPYARVCHSKYMVVDGRTLWLGTSNWTGGYLNESRNLELVVKDPALAARAAAVQTHLWDSVYSAALPAPKAYSQPPR
jgi:phosphatidylserine/phosphatidylglycerophosphate/cardiolipin synthase-like enzyme